MYKSIYFVRMLNRCTHLHERSFKLYTMFEYIFVISHTNTHSFRIDHFLNQHHSSLHNLYYHTFLSIALFSSIFHPFFRNKLYKFIILNEQREREKLEFYFELPKKQITFLRFLQIPLIYPTTREMPFYFSNSRESASSRTFEQIKDIYFENYSIITKF